MIGSCPKRRGAMMVLIVIMLPVLFLIAAFAVNIAYIELVRTEAQIATDVACRAAGRTYAETQDINAAIAAAQTVANRNTVGGQPFPLAASDLEFGLSLRPSLASRYSFEPSATINAVRVTSTSFATGSSTVSQLMAGIGPSFTIGPVKSAISTQTDLDIALVIDRSGSMAYAANEPAAYPPNPAAAPVGWDFGHPVPPNARWLDAIAAVNVFLDTMNDTPQLERIGLATYNNVSAIDSHVTSNYSDIISGLNVYSLAYHEGGTNIGDGILAGVNILSASVSSRPWATRVIVVMTDGIHNTGTWPEWAAQQAANNGIMVFSVTFSNEAPQWLMQSVANIGGGQHYHAVDAVQLRDAFRDIAKQLPTLLTQ